MNMIERHLLGEISAIDRRIDALRREQDVLKRQLLKVRRHYGATLEATRSNSTDRVIAESLIRDAIKRTGRPRSTKEIYQELKASLPTLYYGTFRTYLSRMKEKGILMSPQRSLWDLSAEEKGID